MPHPASSPVAVQPACPFPVSSPSHPPPAPPATSPTTTAGFLAAPPGVLTSLRRPFLGLRLPRPVPRGNCVIRSLGDTCHWRRPQATCAGGGSAPPQTSASRRRWSSAIGATAAPQAPALRPLPRSRGQLVVLTDKLQSLVLFLPLGVPRQSLPRSLTVWPRTLSPWSHSIYPRIGPSPTYAAPHTYKRGRAHPACTSPLV